VPFERCHVVVGSYDIEEKSRSPSRDVRLQKRILRYAPPAARDYERLPARRPGALLQTPSSPGPAANSKPVQFRLPLFGLKVPCSCKGRPVEPFESAGGKTRSVEEARDNSGFGSEDAYSD
jgi:hypothetical protein